MSQKCPKCPDIIWDMCYSMLIISGLLLSKFYCTHPIPPDCEFGIMCAPSKDTRRRRVCSQIKEEKEEKEKEGGKEEIVNGIYILIEWRFVNWSMLIYNIPLIFIYFSTCYSIINLFT